MTIYGVGVPLKARLLREFGRIRVFQSSDKASLGYQSMKLETVDKQRNKAFTFEAIYAASSSPAVLGLAHEILKHSTIRDSKVPLFAIVRL